MIRNFSIYGHKTYTTDDHSTETYAVDLPDDERVLFVNIDDDNITVTTKNFQYLATCGCSQPFDIISNTILDISIPQIRHYEHHSYFKIACDCYLKYLEEVKGHTVTKEFEDAYAPANDITFILETKAIDGEVLTQEVVGFYYGEPNEVDTQYYGSRCDTIAFYGDDVIK